MYDTAYQCCCCYCILIVFVRYDRFPSQQDYQQVVKHAKVMSVYLWSNDTKRLLMVTETGLEQMKAYIKNKIENK